MKKLSLLGATAIVGLIVVPGIFLIPTWGQGVFWQNVPPSLPGQHPTRPNIPPLPKRSETDPPLLINNQRELEQRRLEAEKQNPCGPDADATGFKDNNDGTVDFVNLECEALKDAQRRKGK